MSKSPTSAKGLKDFANSGMKACKRPLTRLAPADEYVGCELPSPAGEGKESFVIPSGAKRVLPSPEGRGGTARRRGPHALLVVGVRGFSFSLSLIFMLGPPLNAAENTSAPPSVILISIDTLRADHLSAYGYSKIRTPHIDSFADGGTLFTQAEAQIPLTLPSHTSLFTSTYPFQNLVEENGERVPADAVTLASVLHSQGYKTAAFIGSDYLDRRYGLDQGFDDYDSPFGEETRNPLAASLRRDGTLVVRAARQWLDAHRGQPVFAFVHLYDLHVPYALPPEVAQKQGISRYDAQLLYVDQVLGRFRQELEESGWWDKSLIIIFGDHGEGLGDHRETDHGYYIYESTLHVPLILHWPRIQEMQNSKFAASLRIPGYILRACRTHRRRSHDIGLSPRTRSGFV